MLVVNHRIRIPRTEFEFTYVRSRGPGGQNVNKVSTKAVLRWDLANSPTLPDDVRDRFRRQFPTRVTKDGEVVITSQRHRDRDRNAEDCLEKLRVLLASVATAPRRRKKTVPTRASRERRLREKKLRSEKKRQRGAPDRE
jgi:ribosome-associated protein